MFCFVEFDMGLLPSYIIVFVLVTFAVIYSDLVDSTDFNACVFLPIYFPFWIFMWVAENICTV